MSATLTRPRLEKDDPCRKFVEYMIHSEEQRDEDGVPLSEITKQFSIPLIAKAFALDLIELGQRRHSWTGPTPGMVYQRDPETGEVIEEHYEDKRKLHTDKHFEFVLLKHRGSKSVKAIIKEDESAADPLKYHVRLTNDGLAAAA